MVAMFAVSGVCLGLALWMMKRLHDEEVAVAERARQVAERDSEVVVAATLITKMAAVKDAKRDGSSKRHPSQE
jgi:hypothetical protein